ncbi:hypothetical protein PVL29_013656 [Vitis rotundifolia]|uniref:Cytochrome P450 n=1 Tax=Vitis rotundifolia TaxID=103349 RepID=A0AA38ZNL4_VITRO|nr:hypothetical protein PVL29_013656 [Vitis rotundifolia]
MEGVLPELIFYSLVALCIVVWIILFIWLGKVLHLEPSNIRLKLRRQGIKGPPPAFVMGNIPEMKRIMSMAADAPRSEAHLPLGFSSSTTFPYFAQWTKLYGGTFTFALGNEQLLYVTDTKLVKEINLSKTLDLGKPSYLQKDRGPLLGKGLITSNGAVWFHQRKTIAPQLFMDKVKGNLNIMVESASNLVSSWLGLIELGSGSADIRVDDYIRSFTSTVISKMMFGSHHSKAVELFPKCRALMKDLQTPTILKGIPFFSCMEDSNHGFLTSRSFIHSRFIDVAEDGDSKRAMALPISCIYVNIGLERYPELWGFNAKKFNPERFANGISGAYKSPNAYIPFGVRTRMCPSQNLAITEMKILFAIILSHSLIPLPFS